MTLRDHLDGTVALAVALLGAARDDGQCGHRGDSGDDGGTKGSHEGSTRVKERGDGADEEQVRLA